MDCGLKALEGDLVLESFQLESGAELRPLVLHYVTYGSLNEAHDNAVLVCHALSGSARVDDWWSDLFAPGGLDLDRDFVVCVNIPGSCYGSTGPASINPETQKPYGPDFPLVTVRDIVRAEAAVIDALGVEQLGVVIGGSIGGMQALEWSIQYPERVQNCISIGAARLSAMGLALNHLQRKAIELDPAFKGGRYEPGFQPGGGIAIARGLAMCTYKSAELFTHRYGRKPNRNGEDPFAYREGRFDVAGYLDYQGDIFIRRFDANCYIAISKITDTFDFARGFASEQEALSRISARVLLIGISSDWLFPPADVAEIAKQAQAAGVTCSYRELVSEHGHDAFLAEPKKLLALISPVLRGDAVPARDTNHPTVLEAGLA